MDFIFFVDEKKDALIQKRRDNIWPNGIIFHQPRFEIWGPSSLTITTIWGKPVVWGRELICPEPKSPREDEVHKSEVACLLSQQDIFWLKNTAFLKGT